MLPYFIDLKQLSLNIYKLKLAFYLILHILQLLGHEF